MKKVAIASLAMLFATAALAYAIHHPNIREAYDAAGNAIRHIQTAQAFNKGIEFGGHAEKAISLLQQAQNELVAGDQFNDAHH
jgi:hypothetical protein